MVRNLSLLSLRVQNLSDFHTRGEKGVWMVLCESIEYVDYRNRQWGKILKINKSININFKYVPEVAACWRVVMTNLWLLPLDNYDHFLSIFFRFSFVAIMSLTNSLPEPERV